MLTIDNFHDDYAEELQHAGNEFQKTAVRYKRKQQCANAKVSQYPETFVGLTVALLCSQEGEELIFYMVYSIQDMIFF